MRKRKKRIISSLLAAVMTVTVLPAEAIAVGTEQPEDMAVQAGYTFNCDSASAKEYPDRTSELTLTVTRSGDLAEEASMKLLVYDISTEYGEDYTVSVDGNDMEQVEGAASLYSAYRDHSVVGDYQENSQAYLYSLMSSANISSDDCELEISGLNDISSGKATSEKAGNEKSDETEKEVKKSLSDADSNGISAFSSLATLDDMGTRAAGLTVSFAAGEHTKEVKVSVLADEKVEYGEAFLLALVSEEIDRALPQCSMGLPDIPLVWKRDIATVMVTVEDSSEEHPTCEVRAESCTYKIKDGEETAEVLFTREGELATVSTVILSKDNKPCGYFFYAPWQTEQSVKLGVGTYSVTAYRGCTLAGGDTVKVSGTNALEADSTANGSTEVSKAGGTEKNSVPLGDDYYSPLPESGQEQKPEKDIPMLKSSSNKVSDIPEWFPDWAKSSGRTETVDYISYSEVGKELFKQGGKNNYGSYMFINDTHWMKDNYDMFNTFRLNTSGTWSTTKKSYVYGDSRDYYDMTGIGSVETRYNNGNDDDFEAEIGISNIGRFTYREKRKGYHDIVYEIPEPKRCSQYVFVRNNDYSNGADGVAVFFINALKFNKRQYQIRIENSNELQYVTKAGTMENVASKVVAADQNQYLKFGDTSKSVIAVNTESDSAYPMRFVGYQLMDKLGTPGNTISSQSTNIQFSKDFLKNYEEKYCFKAEREGNKEAYYTFHIRPVMEKIPVKKFDVINNTKDTNYNPYQGKLVIENKDKNLCQGDYVTLSATDVAEGYTLTGASIKYRKTEDGDWQTDIKGVGNDGKVIFRLGAGYSYYEVEPVFSGHEADTVTVTYADDAAKSHGTITGKNTPDAPDTITMVTSGEYRKNSYIPLMATPKDGYVTCWYSGNRTYYGNVFYMQMDGNSKHNQVYVDFIAEKDLSMKTSDLRFSLWENEPNLRIDAETEKKPIANTNYTLSAGQNYTGTTDAAGKGVVSGFRGVVGGHYSMMLTETGQNRYRYIEFEYSGTNEILSLTAPYFMGLAAYPDTVTARSGGTSSGQAYIDVKGTENVDVSVVVYQPDKSTKVDSVGLKFYYENESGEMAQKDYTLDNPDSSGEDADTLGIYSTYTLSVLGTEIPDMSYLYVDVKSTYTVKAAASNDKEETMEVKSDTGYVNTGYHFKTPSESDDLAVQMDMDDIPGLTSVLESKDFNNLTIPNVGTFDFGLSAGNGTYFGRVDDPNSSAFYFIMGYNVSSTWDKTLTDRKEAAISTKENLQKAAADKAKAMGSSDIEEVVVRGQTQKGLCFAPVISIKITFEYLEDSGGYCITGIDEILGIDEKVAMTFPFNIYGVPIYINLTVVGEQYMETHNVINTGLDPDNLGSAYDEEILGYSDFDIYAMIPQINVKVKAGVGYNSFASVYIFGQGNLKLCLDWDIDNNTFKAGGHIKLDGGEGFDLAVFSLELKIGFNTDFGDDATRDKIVSAASAVSSQADPLSSGILDAAMDAAGEAMNGADEKDVKITLNRSQSKQERPDSNRICGSAARNNDVTLIHLGGSNIMALTLADNGAADGSVNFLKGVYAISRDGGRTWSDASPVSESNNLQWNVKYHKLGDKILVTWSEGDMDAAVGKNEAEGYSYANVAKALNSMDISGRYFDLEGNPSGESFLIAADDSAALNVLDVAESTDGSVSVYYEKRAYNAAAVSLKEIISQEQTIHKAVLGSSGNKAAESSSDNQKTVPGNAQQYRLGSADKKTIVKLADGDSTSDEYRITELKAFSWDGIEGEILVVDADGRLFLPGEDKTGNPSIDDRQIFVRVESDKKGIIKDGTVIPLTESGVNSQHIELCNKGEHIYLFWNENGSIAALDDFLPRTAEAYSGWQAHAEDGTIGHYTLVSQCDTLMSDTKIRVAMNGNGKGTVLWKDEFSDNTTKQIYATAFEAKTIEDTDENNSPVTYTAMNSIGGPVPLTDFANAVHNMDVQVLDDGSVVFGYTKLDGSSLGESSRSDVVVETADETCILKIAGVSGQEYPREGEEYTSYLTVRNEGLAEVDMENIVVSASGALNGSATLAQLTADSYYEADSGADLKVSLPVTAGNGIKDGDAVTYQISNGETVLDTYKYSVRLGKNIVITDEYARITSIPGTSDYMVTVNVRNDGNVDGTTDITYYAYTKNKNNPNADGYEKSLTANYSDTCVLAPGESTVISYRLENAAYDGNGMRMLGVWTGEKPGQCVESLLPDAVKITANKPSVQEEDNHKKGDIVTAGSKTTKAKYKITSTGQSGTAAYYKCGVSSKDTSAKVPDTVKIGGRTYKVTAVAENAFKDMKKLKKIEVGINVTNIKKRAFYNCQAVSSIVCSSKKIKEIGSEAFYNCMALKSADFNTGKLEGIGSKAFYGCKALKMVSFHSSQIQTVGSKAFYNCKALKTVKFSAKQVRYIGSGAFYGCKLLESINISSDKLEKIGHKAFYGCKKITMLTIKSKKLSKKNVKNSLEGSSVKTIKTTDSLKSDYKKYFTKKNSGKDVKLK